MLIFVLFLNFYLSSAAFTPADNTALYTAVASCLGETPDGLCPTFAASNDATGNPYGAIGTWDVSAVTSLYYLFQSSAFNADISEWNTAAVTIMSGGMSTPLVFCCSFT